MTEGTYEAGYRDGFRDGFASGRQAGDADSVGDRIRAIPTERPQTIPELPAWAHYVGPYGAGGPQFGGPGGR